MSPHDPLTGLPSRESFLDRLGRTQSRCALLLADLDRVQAVNASLGQEAGDRLLAAVARRFQSCLAPCATLARFGGDEFAVLLEDVDDEEPASLVARNLSRALQEPFRLRGVTMHASVSIGIAVADGRTTSADEL